MTSKTVAIGLAVVLGLTLAIGAVALVGKGNEVSAAQQVVAQKSSDFITVTEQLQAKTTEVNDLNTKVNDLNTKVTNLTTERNDLATTLTARNDELKAANELVAAQTVSLTALTAKNGDLQKYRDDSEQPVAAVVSYTLLGPDGSATPVNYDLTLTAASLVSPESTPIFDLGVVTYTTSITSGNKYDVLAGFRADRGQDQEPRSCDPKLKDEYGMCAISFDVSKITMVGGAGYQVGDEKRLFRADLDEYAYNVFVNVTTHTIHIDNMRGYPGSNVIHGWAPITGTNPSYTDTMAAAQDALIKFKADAFVTGQCDVWGCAGNDPGISNFVDVGYTVWACDGNNSCTIVWSYNPAQDPSDTRFMPRHDEYTAIVKAVTK